MTSLYSDYTSLSNYLEGQQFGPKPSVPTPDMAYPILPEKRVNYGYQALTHDSFPYTGYYNIESGYGKQNKCDSFMFGSCPSNTYVRPYAPPAPPTPPQSREGFQLGGPMPANGSVKNQLKDLQIIMFTQDKCKYCTDAVKDLELKKNCPNLKIMNLKDKKNVDLFMTYGGQGVPFFVSEKTRMTFTGHPKTMSNLLQSLEGSQAPAPPTNDIRAMIKDLDVKLLLSRNCGYCKKLKNLLEQNNVQDVVVMFWDNDPQARDVFGGMNIDGVPVIYSAKTGKHIMGAPGSLAQIISELN